MVEEFNLHYCFETFWLMDFFRMRLQCCQWELLYVQMRETLEQISSLANISLLLWKWVECSQANAALICW